MYSILFYQTVDDFINRRAPFREAHNTHLSGAYQRGELVLAGALAKPADRAVLVFKGDDSSVAENFAKADPYVTNGLVRNWDVREWTVVIGG